MKLSVTSRQLTAAIIACLLATATSADVSEEKSDVSGELQRAARDLGADSRMLFGFPTGSSLSLTVTLLTPVIERGPVSGVLNVTYPAVAVPIDKPQQQLRYMEGQRSRFDDLHDIYSHLEETLEGFGYPGSACLQRTLCEATGRRGDSPLLTRVLHLMLEDPVEQRPDDYIAHQMTEARHRGLEDASSCGRFYSECPESLFDLLDAANFL